MLPHTPPPLVVGLIVNKPTDKRLSELLPDSPVLKNRTDDAYFGGPVDLDEPALVFRTAGGAPEHAMPLFEGVYVSVGPGYVAGQLKDRTLKDLRLYFGRAQWSREQLHDEMLRGSWYVVPADPASVFSADPKHVWRALVARAELEKAWWRFTPTRHLPMTSDVTLTSFEPMARPAR
jgi:putative transcriptional regulator